MFLKTLTEMINPTHETPPGLRTPCVAASPLVVEEDGRVWARHSAPSFREGGSKPGMFSAIKPTTTDPMLTRTPKPSALPTAFALLLAVTIAGCSTRAETPAKTYVTVVRTADVVEQTDALPIRSSGRLSPKTSIQLSFKTGGVIESILVDEGDRVRAGQTLARLDLSEIDAGVTSAESAYDKADRDLQRMRNLYADSVVTLEQLQNTETAKTMAESNLKTARFNRRHSEIVAPADGRIQRRHAEPNELVTSGKVILDLGTANGWVVRLGVPDRDVVRLKLGDDAIVHLDAYPGQSFAGLVTEIAEAADVASGTFEVEVSLTEKSDLLKSGFIAAVDVIPSETSERKVIPIEALVEGDGSTAIVYTVDPLSGRARKLSIQIAGIHDDRVSVASGLEGVRTVVTNGAQYLTDGAQVRLEGA